MVHDSQYRWPPHLVFDPTRTHPVPHSHFHPDSHKSGKLLEKLDQCPQVLHHQQQCINAHKSIKHTPKTHKNAPKNTQNLQLRPKCIQKAPRCVPKDANGLQNSTQDGPSEPQGSPRTSQGSPKALQGPPRAPQRHLKNTPKSTPAPPEGTLGIQLATYQ